MASRREALLKAVDDIAKGDYKKAEILIRAINTNDIVSFEKREKDGTLTMCHVSCILECWTPFAIVVENNASYSRNALYAKLIMLHFLEKDKASGSALCKRTENQTMCCILKGTFLEEGQYKLTPEGFLEIIGRLGFHPTKSLLDWKS